MYETFDNSNRSVPGASERVSIVPLEINLVPGLAIVRDVDDSAMAARVLADWVICLVDLENKVRFIYTSKV